MSIKPIKVIFLSLIALFTPIIIIFFLTKEKPYNYFDPKNPNNIYTITADDYYFYVGFDSNEIDNQKSIKSIISSAPVDLHQFLDKKVKLKGKFINTTVSQIIRPKNDYRPSNNKLQALEITDISLAEQ